MEYTNCEINTHVKTTDSRISAPHVTRQRTAVRQPAHSPSAWPACSTNEHRYSPDTTQVKTTDSRTSASHSPRLPPSTVIQHPEDDIPPTIKPCTAISNSKGMPNEPTIPPRHSPHQYQAVLDLIWPQIKTMAWRGHNDFADKYMMIRKTGLPNYLSARQQLVSNLNYDAWGIHERGGQIYSKRMCFGGYAWPLPDSPVHPLDSD